MKKKQGNPNYKVIDVTEIPKGGECAVYRDQYWLCVDGDETKALFFHTTPQANSDLKLTEWVLNRTKNVIPFENVDIVFIDLAFGPIRQ